ncbi:MAG: tRNA (N6-threonylcarbamoyladenosine(37)-N6)-methyltransferase TrmO [Clostridia bacterium]|nr:tRNA (N6-threonylcarbamoyladenosine(37)-N6)-methyltransferase TrmO [Clostridia bacterium]
MKNRTLKVIAHIKTDFPEKFGVPRQSGLVPALKGEIVFCEEYRDSSALKGIEGFSHLWLLWDFSEVEDTKWRPTVRPPRLGGNKRMGVFATRSPFRPNPIGLSCVKLEEVKQTADGAVLVISGADLMDGTPILDIKPYLPFADCVKDATGGFANEVYGDKLEVEIPEEFKAVLSEEKYNSLVEVLKSDPRPAYQDDPDREYGFDFAKHSIKFKVNGKTLFVTQIKKTD